MEQLVKTRSEIIQRVEALPDEMLAQQPAEGKWSIIQVLHHLYLTECSIMRVIAKALKSDKKEEVPSKPLQLVLDRSRTIKAPEYLEPTSERLSKDEVVQLLHESRRKLLDLYEETVKSDGLSCYSYNHPALGEMCLQQWFDFIWMHEQRHLDQIDEIKGII